MRKVINYILILIILFSLYKLISKFNIYNEDINLYKEIEKFSPAKEKSYEKALQEEERLKKINKDFKFWININGTNINYPVVKSIDNDFYLKHNFYKKQSASGSLFIDSNNIVEDKNIIIYGHNMKNGTMFAQLSKFKDKDFFNENKYIDIYKNGEKIKYEIFSVNMVNDAENYLKVRFKSDEEYFGYLQRIKEKSIVYRDIKIEMTEDIITLCTCSYEGENTRLIINAVKK